MAKPSDGPCELRFDYIYFTENLKLLEVKQWLGVSKKSNSFFFSSICFTDFESSHYWVFVPWFWICCFNHIQNAAWWFQIFFIFTPIWPIWGRFPFWLIFFKGVETTNQKCDSQIWNEGFCLSWAPLSSDALQDADTYADATDLWWALWNITQFVASFGSFVTRPGKKHNLPRRGWVGCNPREPSTIETIKDLHGFIDIFWYSFEISWMCTLLIQLYLRILFGGNVRQLREILFCVNLFLIAGNAGWI